MLYKLNAQLGSGFSAAFQEAQAALNEVQTAMQELNAKQSDISAYQKQQAAVEALEDKLQLLQTKLQNVSTEMEQSGTYSSSLANKQATLQTQINQTVRKLESEQAKLSDMEDSLEAAGIDTSDLAGESKKLGAELDDLAQQGKEAAAQVENLGDQSGSAADALTSMASILASAGVISGLKELASAAAECVTTFAEFEAEMSYVEALSGASGSELEALTEKAQELGATTSYTAEEAAEALSYMALAGYDTEEMLSSVDGVLNLAAAAAMDLGTASDIVTDYLTAFGLTADDSAAFVDKLAYAMSNSNTTVEQLGEAYKNVAATANSLGYSVTDVTAVLMGMADAGVKGGEAGTALNTIMTRLATNTKNCESEISAYTESMLGYTFSVYDSEGSMRDLSDILNDLAELWPLLTDQQQANLAKVIAGTNQYSSFQTIMSTVSSTAEDGVSVFAEYAEGLDSCTGAAEEMADVMLDNLSGSMTLLESAVDGLKIAFGEALAPAIEVVVEILTNVVSKITDFISEHEALIAGLTTAVALFAAVVVAVTAFNAIVKIATTVAGLFSVGLNSMLGPIGLVITAISGVVAVGTWLSSVLSEDTVEWEDLGITAAEMGEMIAEGTITAEEAMETYGITEEQVTEATEAYAEAQAEAAEAAEAEAAALVEAVESMGVAEGQMVTLEQAAKMVNDGLLDAADAAEIFKLDEDALTEEVEAQTAADEALEQAVALVEGGYLDAATAAAYFGTTAEEIETEATQEQLLNLIDVYYDLYDAAYDSIEGQFSLWDEASEVSASSLGTLQDNLESQIDYWNSYNTNLQTVSAAAAALGIDLTTVWGTLTDGSEDAVNAVAGMAEALNAGDTESFESYFDSLNKLEDAMAGVSSTIATGGETVQNAIEDVTGNAAAALWQMYQDGTITAEQCIEAYRLVSDETEEWSAAAETAESDLAAAAVLVASGFMTASEAANQFGVSVTEIETVTTAIEDLQTAYEEAYESAYESISGQYSLWEEAAEQSSTSLSTLTSNVESQTAYWKDYNENLQTVAAAAEQLGIDISDLWPALTDGSEDAVNAVAGMAEALEAGDTSGFQSYIESYQELQDAISEVSSTIAGQTEEVQTALDEFTAAVSKGLDGAELAESFSQSAADTIQGYLDGLADSEGEVSADLAEDAAAWLESLNSALGVHSPSTITYESGVDTIQGFVNGAESMIEAAETAMQNIANLSIQAFEDELGYDALYESGQNAIQGAIQGIEDALPSLVETAREAGTAAANAYKEAQDINSPSKLFYWFSEMDIAGAIEGLQDGIPEMEAAFEQAGAEGAQAWQTPQLVAAEMPGFSGQTVINFSPTFTISGVSDASGVQNVLTGWTDDMRDYILQVVEEANENRNRRVYA